MVDGVIKAHDPGMTVTPVPFVAGAAPAAAMPPGAGPAPKTDAAKPATEGSEKPAPGATPASTSAPAAKQ